MSSLSKVVQNPLTAVDKAMADGTFSDTKQPRCVRKMLTKIEGVHSDRIHSACFSPDGKTLCLASHDKTASLIEVATGAVLRKIEGVHSDRIHSACFSPDGNTLSFGSNDKTASLLEIATGVVLRKIEGVHSGGIFSVCFSPDGNTLGLASDDKTASLVDVATGAVLKKIEGVHTEAVLFACFSPDGNTLCLTSGDCTASLIEVATGAVLRKIEGVHSATIFSACFSPDGYTVCLTSADRTASLIEFATGAVLRKIDKVHPAYIHSACFSPDGYTLCLGSWDKSASLIEVATGALLRKFEGVHSSGIWGTCFSPDGNTLCLASADKTASLIEVAMGVTVKRIDPMHSASIWSSAFSPDGNTLCLGSDDKTASLIDVATGTVLKRIKGVHSAGIYSCCFSPDGKTLCLGSHDNTASLIEVTTGAVLRKIEGVHSMYIYSVCFSPDGKTLSIASADKTASLIEVATGAVLRKIEGVHSDRIHTALISPDGKTLGLVSDDKTASLIEVATGAVLRKIEGVHSVGIHTSCFSPDGKIFALGAGDGTSSLIEVATGAVLRKIEGVHSGGLFTVCFTPDGNTLGQVSTDTTASLIEVATGAVLKKIEGVHSAYIMSGCFSPDGNTFCLTSDDSTASLIDCSWLAMGRAAPRWVDVTLGVDAILASGHPQQLVHAAQTVLAVFPEVALTNSGALLRHAVELNNTIAFETLADAVDSSDVKTIPLYPDASTGRSLVRRALEMEPPNRTVVQRLFAMFSAGVASSSGYAYAVHFEAAPTLKDDLIFISKYATSCIEPAAQVLEMGGMVLAPSMYQRGTLRMSSLRPVCRPRFTPIDENPFADLAGGDIVHNGASQIVTEVKALAIPGLCEPGVDYDPNTHKTIAGLFLFDCIVDIKHARAINSEPLRTLIPFMWEKFGRSYAQREAVLYIFGFLIPVSLMCGSLAQIHTHDDFGNVSNWMSVVLGLSVIWALRQLIRQVQQCFARRSFDDYLRNGWNIIDVLLLALYCVAFTLFLIPELWWCKQAAAITILLSYLKCTMFAQAIPKLGRLVQLVFSVVSATKEFMALLGLAVVGLGFAFLLVFSAGPVSRVEADNTTATTEGSDDEIEFGSVPVSFFRSFTTINGDFDVTTLWLRGSPAIAVFLLTLLFGNVVMLNLLIAIVSDEFDQFMDRANLVAQLAVASICKDAREVLKIDAASLPDVFQRRIFVLQGKASDLPKKDEWAGKVRAIVKRVDSRADELEAKQVQLEARLGARMDKMDKKLEKILSALNLKSTLNVQIWDEDECEADDFMDELDISIDELEPRQMTEK